MRERGKTNAIDFDFDGRRCILFGVSRARSLFLPVLFFATGTQNPFALILSVEFQRRGKSEAKQLLTRVHRLPVQRTWWILPGTSSALKRAGRAAALCGTWRSPMQRTSTIWRRLLFSPQKRGENRGARARREGKEKQSKVKKKNIELLDPHSFSFFSFRPQPLSFNASSSLASFFIAPFSPFHSMLRRPDARAEGISVTFTTVLDKKSDRRAPERKATLGERDDDAAAAPSAPAEKACEAAAHDPSTAPTRSPSPSSPPPSLLSSAASSLGVYAGFYWWILVITAGLGPTLWSTMALCWHLGDCPKAWACLAASGAYWVRSIPSLLVSFFLSVPFSVVSFISVSFFFLTILEKKSS